MTTQQNQPLFQPKSTLIQFNKQQVVFILGCLEQYSLLNPSIHNVRDDLFPEYHSQMDVLTDLFNSLVEDMDNPNFDRRGIQGFCL